VFDAGEKKRQDARENSRGRRHREEEASCAERASTPKNYRDLKGWRDLDEEKENKRGEGGGYIRKAE